MPGLRRRLRALAAPPDASPRRRRALRIAGLAVVAAFGAFAAAEVDLRRVLASLSSASPGMLLAAVVAKVASLWTHAERWGAVIRPHGTRVRVLDVFQALVAGLAVGIAVPARAGDFVRAHLLARRARLSTTCVIASAAVDYIVSTASLVPLLALLAAVTPLPGWARNVLLVSAAVSAGGVLGVVTLRPSRGGSAPEHGAAGLVARFRSGLAAVHDPGAIARSFAWGFAGWGADLLIAWCVLAAVGVEPTWTLASLAVLSTSAANAIAVSPGNAGPFELAAMLPLSGLGIPREPALAFALLLHVAHLAPIAASGAFVLLREATQAKA